MSNSCCDTADNLGAVQIAKNSVSCISCKNFQLSIYETLSKGTISQFWSSNIFLSLMFIMLQQCMSNDQSKFEFSHRVINMIQSSQYFVIALVIFCLHWFLSPVKVFKSWLYSICWFVLNINQKFLAFVTFIFV